MVGVPVVLEHIFDVHGSLATGLEDIRESLGTQFPVDVHVRDGIVGGRLDFESGKREDKALLPGQRDLEHLPPIVGQHAANLHRRPSASSCSINSRSLADAFPFIAVRLSRSHFTMSLPFR